jgi:hypothetical protein
MILDFWLVIFRFCATISPVLWDRGDPTGFPLQYLGPAPGVIISRKAETARGHTSCEEARNAAASWLDVCPGSSRPDSFFSCLKQFRPDSHDEMKGEIREQSKGSTGPTTVEKRTEDKA